MKTENKNLWFVLQDSRRDAGGGSDRSGDCGADDDDCDYDLDASIRGRRGHDCISDGSNTILGGSLL